jgi:hypothetical protein
VLAAHPPIGDAHLALRRPAYGQGRLGALPALRAVFENQLQFEHDGLTE